MRVWLTPELASRIADHARQVNPHECCGVLGGRGGDVLVVLPVENVSPTPETAFEMSPEGLARALMGLERHGLSLVGFYHSHPRTPPIPSGRDIAEAHYPDAAQVLVSLRHGDVELAAWQIRYGGVERLELVVDSARPPDWVGDDLRPSGFERVMTVVAGIVAMAVVIGLALALLPPPPVLD